MYWSSDQRVVSFASMREDAKLGDCSGNGYSTGWVALVRMRFSGAWSAGVYAVEVPCEVFVGVSVVLVV